MPCPHLADLVDDAERRALSRSSGVLRLLPRILRRRILAEAFLARRRELRGFRDERRTEARRLLDGLNGQWVARRMGVGDATVSAWRRGDRVPDLGDLLALAIAVGRPLDPELDAQVVRLLEAGRITVSPRPAVLEAAGCLHAGLLDARPPSPPVRLQVSSRSGNTLWGD